MGVRPGAGPQFQHVFFLVQGPDAGERRIEASHHALGAALEDVSQGPAFAESGAHVRPQGCVTYLPAILLLRTLALRCVPDDGEHETPPLGDRLR